MRFTRSERGCLYTVSGPSGSGKTSLCVSLLEATPMLHLSVSCTTRTKRPGEIEAKDYHFLSEADFQAQVKEGAFLEYALVHGNMYGTRSSDIESMLARGYDVLLEIDWQGACQVAEKMSNVCRIFVLPPSLSELRHRLQQRGQDNADVIERRVLAAREESRHEDEAEFRIINLDFGQSLNDLKSIVRAHRLREQLVKEVETSP
ncbi:MAG: guanylate kinase [Mariprofundaceae bacterium]